MGVHDSSPQAKDPCRGHHPPVARLGQRIAQIRLLASVKDAGPGDGSPRLAAQQVLAPDRWEIGARADRQGERSIRPGIEVKRQVAALRALHQLELEQSLPADLGEQRCHPCRKPRRGLDGLGERRAAGLGSPSPVISGSCLREQLSVGEHPGERHHCARFVPLNQTRTTVPGNRLRERAPVRDEPGPNSSLGAHHLQDRSDRLEKHRKAEPVRGGEHPLGGRRRSSLGRAVRFVAPLRSARACRGCGEPCRVEVAQAAGAASADPARARSRATRRPRRASAPRSGRPRPSARSPRGSRPDPRAGLASMALPNRAGPMSRRRSLALGCCGVHLEARLVQPASDCQTCSTVAVGDQDAVRARHLARTTRSSPVVGLERRREVIG